MTDDAATEGTDAASLRAKYLRERDKRLDAARQEIPELVGPLAKYLDDPYATPTEREPVEDEMEAVVIGAGLGGLLVAAALRGAGIERLRIIDKAGDVGGVWYWNRYPGAMCDVESLIYMPLLEELGYTPSMRYAPASEILQHAQAIAKHYNLYEHGLFQTTVTAATWSETDARWTITTDRADTIRSRYLIIANGPLSALKLPAIAGIETFEGQSFHTSRWDYGYTGGGPDAEMTGLRDKAVGVVGTGATGIQCVPPLARAAKHLYVFQRTPSTVAVRDNRPIEPEWVVQQPPGWQARRRRNFTAVLAGAPVEEDLVDDSWTDLYQEIVANPEFARLGPDDAERAMELTDLARMDAVRARVDEEVVDRAVAAALKPYYAYLCKRPGFHDQYLAAFNRPNVTLVDTDGRGLDRVYERGVVVGDHHYELDCLIFATGFEFDTPYVHRIGFNVTGRGDGRTLSEKWADGLATLHGLMTSGFPNFFVMPGVNAQSVVTVNLVDTMQENAAHVGYIVGELRRRGATVFDVDPAAERAWVQTIIDEAEDKTEFLEACTPGRNNNEGRIDQRPPQNASYGGGPLQFYELLADWRRRGDLAGLQLHPEG